MSSKLYGPPRVVSLPSFLRRISRGEMLISTMAVEWPPERRARLVESVLRGFPIGLLMTRMTSPRFGRALGRTPPRQMDAGVEVVVDGGGRAGALFSEFILGAEDSDQILRMDMDKFGINLVRGDGGPSAMPVSMFFDSYAAEEFFDGALRMSSEAINRARAMMERVRAFEVHVLELFCAADCVEEIVRRANVG